MRSGVQRHNASHGVIESEFSGYNETTTQAFLRLVAATMAAYEAEFPSSNADAFCNAHPQLMTRHVLRLFYSVAHRKDPRAKTEFIEPDLAPLPKILGDG